MTVRKTYECDLCGSWHNDKLIGIYWKANKEIELKPYQTSEHHICLDCLTSLLDYSLDEILKFVEGKNNEK